MSRVNSVNDTGYPSANDYLRGEETPHVYETEIPRSGMEHTGVLSQIFESVKNAKKWQKATAAVGAVATAISLSPVGVRILDSVSPISSCEAVVVEAGDDIETLIAQRNTSGYSLEIAEEMTESANAGIDLKTLNEGDEINVCTQAARKPILSR